MLLLKKRNKKEAAKRDHGSKSTICTFNLNRQIIEFAGKGIDPARIPKQSHTHKHTQQHHLDGELLYRDTARVLVCLGAQTMVLQQTSILLIESQMAHYFLYSALLLIKVYSALGE